MTADPSSLTVEELLAVNVLEGSVFDELSRISATASAGGVEVTVNLEGRLTGLELAPRALSMAPADLAGEIFRLTQQASAAALTQGMAALAAVGEEELATELAGAPAGSAGLTGPVAPAPAPEDDFSAVASWALP